MKIQRLIILGILKERPRHGYEIKKIIQKDLGLFTSLENKSIYYPLQIMENKNLISKDTVQGKGKLLRHVYSITPLGEKEFLHLAQEALLSEKRPFIDIDIPLYFLPHLEKKEIMARLRLRKRFLDKVRTWLTGNIAEKKELLPHQRLLLKHHLNLLNTEEKFVEEIIEIVKER
ncbi:MAG: PadR family transcriptional regulator [Candidatus Omnitrophica bacterium]|nr:PadR family transcriptional regulator [Candidatus Omnitrophota bacterium]